MTKFAFAAAAATLFAAPAMAAPTISLTGASGVYSNSTVTCTATAPCNFYNRLTFTTPTGYNLVSIGISSNYTGSNTVANIDFSSVTLNGVELLILSSGKSEFRQLLDQAMLAGGTNVIEIRGRTGGNAAYNGTLSFDYLAVPEPSTWAMMIIGVGATGGALRRRRVLKLA